jgi:hypothetical protein
MDRIDNQPALTKIGIHLQSTIWFKIGEIVLVFVSAFALIQLLSPLAEGDPILKQAVVWIANILLLFIVAWLETSRRKLARLWTYF